MDIHDKITEQAAQWDANERHLSYLLFGDDLKAARAWLADNRATATPLQTAFIEASGSSLPEPEFATPDDDKTVVPTPAKLGPDLPALEYNGEPASNTRRIGDGESILWGGLWFLAEPLGVLVGFGVLAFVVGCCCMMALAVLA